MVEDLEAAGIKSLTYPYSYNRVNNSYACANSKILNGLLKTELGFQGFVVSDWGAQRKHKLSSKLLAVYQLTLSLTASGVGSLLAGLDMIMPAPKYSGLANFTEAIKNGSVPLNRLNDMVMR
jgi:beta-glucosidase-like glycosyl hydrolase